MCEESSEGESIHCKDGMGKVVEVMVPVYVLMIYLSEFIEFYAYQRVNFIVYKLYLCRH